jgi:hypothetical protein
MGTPSTGVRSCAKVFTASDMSTDIMIRAESVTPDTTLCTESLARDHVAHRFRPGGDHAACIIVGPAALRPPIRVLGINRGF